MRQTLVPSNKRGWMEDKSTGQNPARMTPSAGEKQESTSVEGVVGIIVCLSLSMLQSIQKKENICISGNYF